jgi:hypothetical protein
MPDTDHGAPWGSAGPFVARVLAAHVIGYFVAGLGALATMQYEQRFATDTMAVLMRPVDDPLVAAGPALQVVNGLALGVALAPFRGVVLGERGPRHLFVLLVGLSVFSPQTPGPGNLEGLLYTRVSVGMHLASLPEVLSYAGLVSAGLVWWARHPTRWRDGAAAVMVALILVMSALGVADGLGWLPSP